MMAMNTLETEEKLMCILLGTVFKCTESVLNDCTGLGPPTLSDMLVMTMRRGSHSTLAFLHKQLITVSLVVYSVIISM